jgi:hypothetical protein
MLALDIECKHVKRVRLLYGGKEVKEEQPNGKIKTRVVGGDKKKAGEHAYRAILQWLLEVRELTGVSPLLYISPRSIRALKGYTKGLEEFPLWLVDYGDRQIEPEVPEPWEKWTMWQFTSDGGGKSHGMESNGLDLDYYNGPVSDLERGSLSDDLHHLIDRATNYHRTNEERRAACDRARVMLAELRERLSG